MSTEESIAKAIGREISPTRRLVRNLIFYTIILSVILAIAFLPKEPAIICLAILAGYNFIVLINVAEEATNKWKLTEI